MKKRFLSMLLLVAMVVTALPLVALPTVAAEPEEKTFAADEYNALYATKDLIYALDFFHTNSYWGGDEEAYTTSATYKAAIAAAEWMSNANVSWANLSKGTVRFRDGYLFFDGTNDISVGGIAKATGFFGGNVTNTAGATADLLMQGIGGTIMISNVRTSFNSTYNTLSNVNIQNTDYYALKDPRVNGSAISTSIFARPTNMTISFVIPELTEALSWGSTKLKDGSALGTPIDTTKSPSAAQKYNAYAGEYIEVDGEQVLSIAATSTKLSPFFQPSMITAAKVEYQAGAKLETPLENVLVFFPETQSVTGTYTFMEDGATAYHNPATPFLNNTYAYDAAYVQWSTCTGYYYALRYYNRAITEAEAAQNHFADLVKWFRLDLSGLLQLDAARLAEVAAIAKEYHINSDRDEFAEAVYAKTNEKLTEMYTEKYEGVVDTAIFEVAKQYFLDLSPMIGMPRGILSSTYSLLLGDLSGVADVAAAYKAAIDADIAAYAAQSTLTYEDYNAFYVTEDAILMADYFRYNSLWGETYEMPTPPKDMTAYEYKGATYNLSDEDVSLDWLVRFTFADKNTEILADTYDKKADAAAAAELKKAEGGNYAAATYVVYPKATAVYLAAIEAYQKAFLDFFDANAFVCTNRNTIRMRQEIGAFGPNSWNENSLVNQAACFTVGNGFLATTNAYGSGSYINLSSLPNENAAPNISGEYVMAPGNVTGATGSLPTLHDVPLTGNYAGGNLTITGIGSYTNGGTAQKNWPSSYVIEVAPNQTFTLGMRVNRGSDNASYDVTAFANGVQMADTVNSPDTASSRASTLFYTTKIEPNIYAYRFYSRDLTPAEMAQNHFADVVKYFRLNVSGVHALDDEAKATLYAAVADIDLGASSRADAQAAVTRVLSVLTKAAYDALKGEDARFNALLDLAYEYNLDLTALLASSCDRATIYDAVTADALAGKTMAEAQAILDSALFAAENFYSYNRAGETAWNEMIADLAAISTADAYVDLSELGTLPWSLRKTAVIPTASVAEAQAYVDDFYAEKIAGYGASDYIDFDYNTLYVQDGLFFSMDFFRTNEYWGETAPKLSQDNTSDAIYTGKDGVLASYINYKEGTFSFGLNGAVEGVVENGGLRLTNSSDKIWLNMTFSGQMATTDYDYTVENVMKYGSTISQNQFLHRQNWFAVNPTNRGTENAALTFQKLISQYGTYGTSGGKQGIFSFWNNVHLFGADSPTVVVGNETNTFSFVYRLGEYLESATTPVVGSVPAVVLYMPGSAAPVFTVDSIKNEKALQTNPDSILPDGSYDTANDPGFYGVGPAAIRATWIDRIGYGGFDGYTYAIRYYRRALTRAETLQNHFADLAKFYRLDVSLIGKLSGAQEQELYAAVAGYEIGSADRTALQMAVDAAVAETYEGNVLVDDAAMNAAFLRIAAPAGLDLARIKNLAAESREEIVAEMLDELAPASKINKAVVNKLYDDLTYSFAALTFAGYQVRIDTGAASQNYAGVRAVFDVNEEIVKTLAAEKTVTLTVAISLDGAVGSTIEITYDAETDSLCGVMTTGDVTEDVIFYERDGKTSFNYTVVYKKAAPTAEQLAAEYAYAYTIKAGETAIDFAVKSDTFGETVSAFELYEYFSKLPEYAADRVVADVLSKRP